MNESINQSAESIDPALTLDVTVKSCAFTGTNWWWVAKKILEVVAINKDIEPDME